MAQALASAALTNLQKLLGLSGGDASQQTLVEDGAVQLTLDVANLSASALPGLVDQSTFFFNFSTARVGSGNASETFDPYAPGAISNILTQKNLDEFDVWILGVTAVASSGAAAVVSAAILLDPSTATAGISDAAPSTGPLPLASWATFSGTPNPSPLNQPTFQPLVMRMPRNVDGLTGEIETSGNATVKFMGWCQLVAPGGRPSAF